MYGSKLLLGRKVMNSLDSIFKGRDITLPTNVCLVKAMVLPVVMYGCESWTVKKAECQRLDAFELWCWRRFLRVPWTLKIYKRQIQYKRNAFKILCTTLLPRTVSYYHKTQVSCRSFQRFCVCVCVCVSK